MTRKGPGMAKSIFLFFLLGLGQICFAGRPLEWLTPRLIDLGSIREGEKVSGQIRFVNKGDGNLFIHNVRTSCGCTVADMEDTEIASGDTGKISFTLNTRNFRGVVRKSLSLHLEYKERFTEKFTIQADVFREFDVTPAYFSFYNIPWKPDTVITDTMVFFNKSTDAIHVTKIVSGDETIEITPQHFILAAEKEKHVIMRIKPKAPMRLSKTITIESDYKEKKMISIPVYIDIRE